MSSAARRNVRATADTPAARENALLAAAMAKLNRSSVVWPKVSLCLSVALYPSLSLRLCLSVSASVPLLSVSFLCSGRPDCRDGCAACRYTRGAGGEVRNSLPLSLSRSLPLYLTLSADCSVGLPVSPLSLLLSRRGGKREDKERPQRRSLFQ